MSIYNNAEINKNRLLVFKNKRSVKLNNEELLISRFAECGYWFDKIIFAAFDSKDEIVRAVEDGKDLYENTVIFCPQEMRNTLEKFVSEKYCAEFDNFGTLTSDCCSVFMLHSDAVTALSVEEICAILNKKYNKKSEKSYIKTVGASSEKIAEAIEKAKKICSFAEFNVFENFCDCSIEIILDEAIPKNIYDGVKREMVSVLKEHIYALDNITLEERLVQLLKLRRMKICTAESFTGGGVGKRIVSVSGASEVFYEGLNTYSNESKAERLQVKELTLKHYGAVSEQTAAEMAEGLLSGGNCDISIATTGIAGPKSDNTRKPVGLAYIAVGLKNKVCVYKFDLKGSRREITETAINFALFLAYQSIK